MGNVICTLFENHYHKGVAALINSLYRNGYQGSCYAGYRGNLPSWASGAQVDSKIKWPGNSKLEIGEGFIVYFLPLNVSYHLTNYKPAFMLRIFNEVDREASGLAYFDPDIVVRCNWGFYDKWMSYGVALVHESVHNDKPPTHPIRLEWQAIIKKKNKKVTRQLFSYINGGFCGVARKNIEFLSLWNYFIEVAVHEYHADNNRVWANDKTHPFCFLDQDALNIAAMCSEVPISEIGPEGMDFVHGGCTMSHAAGSSKPWSKNFLLSALSGRPPSLADRMFWIYISNPINYYTSVFIYYKRLSISVAAFIGRFYRRA